MDLTGTPLVVAAEVGGPDRRCKRVGDDRSIYAHCALLRDVIVRCLFGVTTLLFYSLLFSKSVLHQISGSVSSVLVRQNFFTRYLSFFFHPTMGDARGESLTEVLNSWGLSESIVEAFQGQYL